jgi:hypothetical protein
MISITANGFVFTLRATKPHHQKFLGAIRGVIMDYFPPHSCPKPPEDPHLIQVIGLQGVQKMGLKSLPFA